MLTPSHIAVSYLLSQTPRLFGVEVSLSETILIIMAGNILDLDFIFGQFIGKRGDSHHNFPTHTPLAIVVIWVSFLVVYGWHLSLIINLLVLLSLFIHLVLDDLGYWLFRLRLQEESQYPQINWFYPLTKFQSQTRRTNNNSDVLSTYFNKSKANLILEAVIIIAALWLFIGI